MAHNSTILTYNTLLNSIGSGDGTVRLLAPIQWDSRSRRYFRLIKCNFSALIPNIHNIAGENNGLIKVSRDGGATWTSIQLTDGSYDVYDIELAINTTLAAWWTDPTKPGFTIRGNSATDYTYVILDSTTLAAPGVQLGIDFSASLIWDFLGFSNPAQRIFIVDGEQDAPSYAKVNWYGDSISLLITGFGALTIKNGAQSFEAADMPLVLYAGSNEFIYPLQGIPSPKIPLPQCPQVLTEYSIALKGSRTNTTTGVPYPLFFLEGNVNVQFEIFWT